jgi:soluble lytic murein transglycosylase-like protein
MYNVPSYLAVSIADVESKFDYTAINYNTNGTTDKGIMQLNSSWYDDPYWDVPERNIDSGMRYLSSLRAQTDSWYQAVIAYNCGLGGLLDPPAESLDYAARVFDKWARYNNRQLEMYTGR